METCSVAGCQRPASGEMKTETHTYSLCALHAQVLEDRVFTLAKDDEAVARARNDRQAV